MPPNVIFGVFSAYRLKYNSAPADYSAVYVYANSLSEIQKRFPKKIGEKKIGNQKNFFVFRADPYLASFGSFTPDVQIFVDLWNISDWYAKDFLNALHKRIFP